MEKLFESGQSLTLFLLFFVPGFVSLKVYDSLVPSERRDFSKSVFDAIAYSAFNFAALYWLIAWMQSAKANGWAFWTAVVIALFLVPAAWPFFWLRLISGRLFARHFVHPIPRPWDFVFAKRKPYWMIVHLKDGRRIGGLFHSNSFASSHPAEPQVYLEEVWTLDAAGGFVAKVPQTAGIIILGDQIAAVELFS